MNAADLLVGGVIAVILVAAVAYMVWQHRKGVSSCGCKECGCCPSCGGCGSCGVVSVDDPRCENCEKKNRDGPGRRPRPPPGGPEAHIQIPAGPWTAP